MNRTIQIQEQDISRIINLTYVCNAIKSGDMLLIYLVNSSDPTIFRGEPADRIWKILSDSSLTIYSGGENKNAESLNAQASSEN